MKDVYLNFATLLDNGVCNDLQPHQVSVINKRQTVNDHVFIPNHPPPPSTFNKCSLRVLS